jgi:hypothetical protein
MKQEIPPLILKSIDVVGYFLLLVLLLEYSFINRKARALVDDRSGGTSASGSLVRISTAADLQLTRAVQRRAIAIERSGIRNQQRSIFFSGVTHSQLVYSRVLRGLNLGAALVKTELTRQLFYLTMQ